MNMNVGLGHHVFPIAKANNTQIGLKKKKQHSNRSDPSHCSITIKIVHPFPLLKTF